MAPKTNRLTKPTMASAASKCLLFMSVAAALALLVQDSHAALHGGGKIMPEPKRVYNEPATASQRKHVCAHSKVAAATGTPIRNVGQDTTSKRRELAAAEFEPIRIRPVFQLDGVEISAANFVQNTLVPEVLTRVSKMLAVRPVSGQFYAHRQCINIKQLLNGNPACRTYASETSAECSIGDGVTAAIPNTFIGEDLVYPGINQTPTTLAALGPGVADTDYLLIVTAVQTTTCGDSTVAYAAACERDSIDRPTVGRANFCPDSLDSSTEAFEHQVAVGIHEVFHALGFSPTSFPLFRNPDLSPRTPRDFAGRPTSTIDYSCPGIGPTFEYTSSASTMSYFIERGNSCPDQTDPSGCVMKIVTEEVRDAVRDHFDCPGSSLQGAELENQPTFECSVVGAHWEQRIFNTELMVAVFSDFGPPKVSAVTLALFEDSGWYKANYSMVTPMRKGVDWGYKQGCSFALDKCLDTGVSPPVSTGSPPHFVDNTSPPSDVCLLGRRGTGFAALAVYTGLPSQYQYFPEASTNSYPGGQPIQSDYCPFYQSYTNTLCEFNSYAPTQNAQGETHGPNSLCVDSSLVHGDFVPVARYAGCYPVTCLSRTQLQISVLRQWDNPDLGFINVLCNTGETDERSVADYSGTITCLDPAVWCSEPTSYDPADATRPGSIRLSPTTYSMDHSDDYVDIFVQRLSGTLGAATVDYETFNGTALSGVDFQYKSGVVSWADGEQGFESVRVYVSAREEDHEDLTFTVELSSATTAVLETDQDTATITIRAFSGALGLQTSWALLPVCLLVAMWLSVSPVA